MSKIVPNTFMTFNIYVDRAMEHLTDSELRVLLYATRHIMGWQDKVDSRIGCLSLTMFEQGFTVTHEDQTTTTYGGCGLSRPVISKALNSLEKFGFLKRMGFLQDKGQRWQLAETPDWSALEARTAERDAANQKRTAKATAARQGVVTSDVNTPIVTSDVNTIVTSHDTMVVTSDVLNQSHVQSHVKEGEDAREPNPTPQNADVAAVLAHAYWPAFTAGFDGNDPLLSEWQAKLYHQTTIPTLEGMKATPEEITATTRERRAKPRKGAYRFDFVPADLQEYREVQRSKTIISADVPAYWRPIPEPDPRPTNLGTPEERRAAAEEAEKNIERWRREAYAAQQQRKKAAGWS